MRPSIGTWVWTYGFVGTCPGSEPVHVTGKVTGSIPGQVPTKPIFFFLWFSFFTSNTKYINLKCIINVRSTFVCTLLLIALSIINTAHVGLIVMQLVCNVCVVCERYARQCIHYVFIQIRMNGSLTMEVVNMVAVIILEATRGSNK